MVSKGLRVCMYVNAVVLAGLGLYYFVAPPVIVIRELRDPGLATGEIPRFTYGWHKTLTEKFGPWARARVASGRATRQDHVNVTTTEWPVFSAVFYLWATESLQEAWEKDRSLAAVAPKVCARETIEAAAALIADPNHAKWVRDYWGDGYLTRENLFYRMLLISGLTSYEKLTGDARYRELLSSQVESLSNEMDASAHGLLDDYPGECYPVDVLSAVAAIRRADAVLGTDRSAFVARAVRAFEGKALDAETGLPSYRANSRSGRGMGPARGVGISFMLVWSPELWPDTAAQWYAAYERRFWEQRPMLAGFREFSREARESAWQMEVDAGPVIGGFGTAASAFGVAAARVHGRPDHAYALSAEALAASWPLPDGSMLGPRMLSSASDAPYVGETGMLFSLTRTALADSRAEKAGRTPWVVWIGVAVCVGFGLWCVMCGLVLVRRWRKARAATETLSSRQVGAWLVLAVAGVALTVYSNTPLGAPLVLLAPFLVRVRTRVAEGSARER
ncbi:MAG: hypothetical protein HZB26_19900 [Candidatus Hydrogenedentes bacterium]|nr:hypothetical protein [Candidatus Hydrogenedentota bacterium]